MSGLLSGRRLLGGFTRAHSDAIPLLAESRVRDREAIPGIIISAFEVRIGTISSISCRSDKMRNSRGQPLYEMVTNPLFRIRTGAVAHVILFLVASRALNGQFGLNYDVGLVDRSC